VTTPYPTNEPASHWLLASLTGVAALVALLSFITGYRTAPRSSWSWASFTPPRSSPGDAIPIPKVESTIAPQSETDLLALVQAPRDAPLGGVVRDGGTLTIGKSAGFSCAVVPDNLPANYELNVRVTSREGDGLLIGFPVDGRRAMFTIDGFTGEPPDGKMRTALEMIDRYRPQDRDYPGKPRYGQLLKRNVISRITIRVVGNSISLTCDGKPVIDWSGDPGWLEIFGLFNQGSPRQMFVGSWASRYDVTSVTLKPL
jgi:hypothetical protein